MEVEVIRVTKFSGKNGFKGFATVKIVDGEESMIINGFTIGETKAGKLIGKPPQQQNPKDQKYYDIVHLEGDLMWKVSNAIVAAYEGDNESQSDEPKSDKQAAAKTKMEMAREEGIETTIKKIGRFNPWES